MRKYLGRRHDIVHHTDCKALHDLLDRDSGGLPVLLVLLCPVHGRLADLY